MAGDVRMTKTRTVMPMRMMRSGFPAQDTIGRLLVLTPAFGFMIGELAEVKEEIVLICCGIDTSPQRNPVAVVVRESDKEACVNLEWMPLIPTENPAERVRARQ